MRNYAKIHLSISDDPDWRALSRTAQHLYLTLLFSQTINNAGVADWRPNRMSVLAAGWSPDEIEQDGKELEAARFIEIDPATEEVLVRSFIRNDEILSGPKTAQGMANAYKRVVSLPLRATIGHEVARMRREYPDSGAWTIADAVEIAERGASDALNRGYTATYPAPSDTPSDTPSDRDPQQHPPSIPIHQPSTMTTKQPSTKGRRARSNGTRLPSDWQPSQDLITWTKQECPLVDGRAETNDFKDWWAASAGPNSVKKDWDAAFRTWMRRANKDAVRRLPTGQRSVYSSRSTTDERVSSTLARAAQLAAEENEAERKQQLEISA